MYFELNFIHIWNQSNANCGLSIAMLYGNYLGKLKVECYEWKWMTKKKRPRRNHDFLIFRIYLHYQIDIKTSIAAVYYHHVHMFTYHSESTTTNIGLWTFTFLYQFEISFFKQKHMCSVFFRYRNSLAEMMPTWFKEIFLVNIFDLKFTIIDSEK